MTATVLPTRFEYRHSFSPATIDHDVLIASAVYEQGHGPKRWILVLSDKSKAVMDLTHDKRDLPCRTPAAARAALKEVGDVIVRRIREERVSKRSASSAYFHVLGDLT